MNSHSTKEYKVLKKRIENKEHQHQAQKTTKTLLINDVSNEISNLTLQSHISKLNVPASAVVDTGSTHNLLSSSLARQSKINIIGANIKTVVEIANQPVKILGETATTISFTQIPYIAYKAIFLVLDQDEDLLVLGNKFLSLQYSKLDFGKYMLTIDGKNV